eukprot:PhM_4_TR6361/c0_g1_i1/m.70985
MDSTTASPNTSFATQPPNDNSASFIGTAVVGNSNNSHNAATSHNHHVSFAASNANNVSFGYNGYPPTRSPNLGPSFQNLEQIPRSPLLYLLLSVEGRDKLVKALQYTLLGAVWAVKETPLLSHAIDAESWAHRLYDNTVTLNNSRRLFRFGSFLQEILTEPRKDQSQFLRLVSLLKGMVEDIGIVVRKDFAPWLGPYLPQNGIWRPLLIMKLILTVSEISSTFRRLLDGSWERVIIMRVFRCGKRCRYHRAPNWTLSTKDVDTNSFLHQRNNNCPVISTTARGEPGPAATTIATCGHCGSTVSIEQLSIGRKDRHWSIPRLLRLIRGVYWLLSHKKCEFHILFWRSIELLCEMCTTLTRLCFSTTEPFADLPATEPLPRQRAFLFLCGMTSAYLSLFRIYEKGSRI